MKIAGCVFEKEEIYTNTKNEFNADYKGHNISITTNHGFGKPEDKSLKRFNIDVVDNESDSFAICVETYEDHKNIKQAIESALEGAILLPSQIDNLV